MNDEKLLNLAGGKILYKDLRDRIKETTEEIPKATADVLRYTSQDLTEEEKEQARTNIGAVSIDQMDAELNDLWDETDTINDTLAKYNCVKLLKYKNYTSGTVDGVSFQWADSNRCAVSGTPTAAYARWTMHHISHAVTDEQWSRVKLVPGGTYFLHFNSPSKKVKIEIEYEITQSGGSYDQFVYNTGDTLFTIPMSCDAVSISLVVPLDSGEVNETVEYGVYSAPSNVELWDAIGGAVKDVQINGTSVLQDGVANVPVANGSNFGVVKAASSTSYGVIIGADGILRSGVASDAQVKSGVLANGVISPVKQHLSVFYGLSKAAGVDLANETVTLGTYPETSKAAIRSMIGAENGDDIVKVQDTEPASAATKIWLPETPPASVTVPTVAEMESALAGKVGIEDYASTSAAGVVKINTSYGIGTVQNALSIDQATVNMIKIGTDGLHAITPARQEQSVFYGLAKAAGDTTQSASSNAVGVYTDNAKASIKAMLSVQDGSTGTVDISGTTPTIAAVENTRYVCGEVTSLDFTPATSGICIVRFTSGSTVTVLTLPSTVKFPEWFDPTSLETNTIYEICVTDGIYGAVMSWAL